MTRPVVVAAAIAVCAAVIPGATRPASAQPGSNAEVETRPCIGQLAGVLYSSYCVGDTPTAVNRSGAPDPAVVDCDRGPPGALARAVAGARPGATLRIRGSRRACVGGFTINKSLTLEGAGGPTRAVIAAPPGGVCVAVTGTGPTHVTLRNIQLDAAASAVDCLSVSNARATLLGSTVSYDGDGSAVTVTNGGLALDSESVVVARTARPAITVEGELFLGGGRVAAAVTAVAFTPLRDARLTGGRLERLDDWSGSNRVRNSFGLVLHSPSTAQLTQVSELTITGFNRGIYVDGAASEVMLDGVTVRDADWGVLADGPRVSIQHAEIYATEVGVYVSQGEGDLTSNHIFGVRRAGLYAERGARVRAVDNHVFASSEACAALESGNLDGSANNCTPWYDQPAAAERRGGGRASFETLRSRAAGGAPGALDP